MSMNDVKSFEFVEKSGPVSDQFQFISKIEIKQEKNHLNST